MQEKYGSSYSAVCAYSSRTAIFFFLKRKGRRFWTITLPGVKRDGQQKTRTKVCRDSAAQTALRRTHFLPKEGRLPFRSFIHAGRGRDASLSRNGTERIGTGIDPAYYYAHMLSRALPAAVRSALDGGVLDGRHTAVHRTDAKRARDRTLWSPVFDPESKYA